MASTGLHISDRAMRLHSASPAIRPIVARSSGGIESIALLTERARRWVRVGLRERKGV